MREWKLPRPDLAVVLVVVVALAVFFIMTMEVWIHMIFDRPSYLYP